MKGKKTGGRKVGTPNRLTMHTRQLLVNALAIEYENLPSLLDKLTPQERADTICKLSKIIIPQATSTSSCEADKNAQENESEAKERITNSLKREREFNSILGL